MYKENDKATPGYGGAGTPTTSSGSDGYSSPSGYGYGEQTSKDYRPPTAYQTGAWDRGARAAASPPPPGAGGGGPIDASLYGLPGFQEQNDYLKQRLADVAGRQAPSATGATLSPFASAASVMANPAQQAGAVNFGPAGQASASRTGPAAQAADSSFRGNQVDLVNQLNRYATGQESVSQLQLRQAADQNIASQMALAAGARPGMGGMAQRLASQNAGNINTQLAQQAAISGLQERQAAAGQLNSLLGTARGQDQTLGMFNADQTNQNGRLNAQLGTQAGIANAQNSTQMGIAQGNSNANMGMFNAGQTNQMGMFNAGQQNQMNQFNSAAQNQYGYNAANLGQQNNQFNVSAGLQNQSQNDAAMNNALQQRLQLSQLQQYGGLAQANNQNALAMNGANNQTAWNIANLNHVGLGGQLLGAGASALPYMAQLLKSGGGGAGGGGGGLDSASQDFFGGGGAGGDINWNFLNQYYGGQRAAGGGAGGGDDGMSWGKTAGDTAAGASMGASFGPWGAAIGGGLGALYSLF